VEFVKRAYLHVIQQEAQSIARLHEGKCLYAGPNGNACAIGVFLPRELAQELDAFKVGVPWRAVVGFARNGKHVAQRAVAYLEGVNTELANDVQSAHDRVKTRDAAGREQLRLRFAHLLRQARMADAWAVKA
jgi:hypothetical protein